MGGKRHLVGNQNCLLAPWAVHLLAKALFSKSRYNVSTCLLGANMFVSEVGPAEDRKELLQSTNVTRFPRKPLS